MDKLLLIVFFAAVAMAAIASVPIAQTPTAPPSLAPTCVGADKQPDALTWDATTPYSKQLQLDATHSQPPSSSVIELGGRLELKATGKRCEQILEDTKAYGGAKGLTLVLQGVPMPDLPSSWSECPRDPSALCMRFDLVRTSSNAAQRSAWDQLLGQRWAEQFNLEPRLAIGKDLPLVIDGTPNFRVASLWLVIPVFVAAFVGFILTFWKLMHVKGILRDGGSLCYSLGKSQLAFWGLLIIASFIGVYAVTHSIEDIDPHVLILLGITAMTALGSASIGTGDDAKTLAAQIEATKTAVTRLQTALPAPATADAIVRAQTDIATKETAIGTAPVSKGFWLDILNDGNGTSFHRLQVVIWTAVLGIVFIVQVLHVISMPVFPDTLLVLMGISNGTYIGYKFKELTN